MHFFVLYHLNSSKFLFICVYLKSEPESRFSMWTQTYEPHCTVYRTKIFEVQELLFISEQKHLWNVFLPGTRGGTSPVQPLCGPGMRGCQSQTAQIRRDAGLTASPPGSSAEGGRQKDWETPSHRRTLQSGRGGKESGKHRTHSADQFGHLFTGTKLNAHQIPAVFVSGMAVCSSAYIFREEVAAHHYFSFSNDTSIPRNHRI